MRFTRSASWPSPNIIRRGGRIARDAVEVLVWSSRWLVAVVSGVVLAASVATSAQKPAQTNPPPPAPMTLDALLASLPATRPPGLDEPRAQWLVAQPFACLDELQPRPGNRPYFWEATFRPVDNYDKVRAFYGCGDWHSAVNATWTLTVVLKRMPEISVSRLIREKLTDHLGKTNLDGEVAFFKDAGTFERPYGYAWLLTLGAELQTWDDTQAAQWAASVAPLSKYFSEQTIAYLKDLDRPVRTGGQTNTALVLTLAFDASETLHDYALRAAIIDYAKKAYAKDVDCATESEPTAGDLVSPCLSEAALMSRVVDRETFVPWLDKFLLAPNSPKFRPLLTASTAPAGRQGGAGAGANAPPGAGIDAARRPWPRRRRRRARHADRPGALARRSVHPVGERAARLRSARGGIQAGRSDARRCWRESADRSGGCRGAVAGCVRAARDVGEMSRE